MLPQEGVKLMIKQFAVPTLAVMAFAGVGFAQPLERNAPCGDLPRTDTYNGWDITYIQQNHDGNNWPVMPSQALRNQGTIQEPLSPQESTNCIEVPAGLKLQLMASELTPGTQPPGLHYLIHFTFDERGRVWALDARDYPYTHSQDEEPRFNFSNPPTGTGRYTQGNSRIVILEDTNGDGAMDMYRVFYSGLVVPTGLELVNGGVAVTVPPYVIFIPIEPGDQAGDPVELVTGLGSAGANFDTHFQANHLVYGLDNWLYGHAGSQACGGNSSNVTGAGSRSGNCSGGNIWRFKHVLAGHDTSRFEVYHNAGPTNASGIGQMEDGQWFKSGATCSPHSNHAVRAGSSDQNPILQGNASCNTNQAGDGHVYFPITDDAYYWEGSNTATRTFNGQSFRVSTSTATNGHDFYTARLLPQKYWNRFAFVCDGSTKLCNMDSMVVNGSSWSAVRMPGPERSNIFAGRDAWVAPLQARTGPDGGIWVLDWYNYIFLHNPKQSMTNGAYRNGLRAKFRSRLYRIIPESGETDSVLNLTNATTNQLVGTFWNTNFLWRLHAQRLLINKEYTSTERDSLLNLLEDVLTQNRHVDEVGIGAPVLHALWTVEGLGEFRANPERWDPILEDLLLHPAWTVRRNVAIAMPGTAASAEAIKEQCAVNDEHAHVRLQALFNLTRMPDPPSGPMQSLAGLRSDNHLTNAFNAAGNTKVTSTAGDARPASCPEYEEAGELMAGFPEGGSSVTPARSILAHHDLRFNVMGNRIELMTPPAAVGAGTLTVYDLRGRVAFRSNFNGSTWSHPVARDMNQPVYFYSFRGVNGDAFNGRISMARAY
jgi:uncharacterized protein